MAATYIETGNRGQTKVAASPPRVKLSEKLSEYFWFSVCFILFLILGPFAAPIALCFMFSRETLDAEMAEPVQMIDG